MMKGSNVTLEDDPAPREKKHRERTKSQTKSVEPASVDSNHLNSIKEMEKNLERERERMRRDYEAQMQRMKLFFSYCVN